MENNKVNKDLIFSVINEHTEIYRIEITCDFVGVMVNDKWLYFPKEVVEIFLNMNDNLKEAFEMCEYDWF